MPAPADAVARSSSTDPRRAVGERESPRRPHARKRKVPDPEGSGRGKGLLRQNPTF